MIRRRYFFTMLIGGVSTDHEVPLVSIEIESPPPGISGFGFGDQTILISEMIYNAANGQTTYVCNLSDDDEIESEEEAVQIFNEVVRSDDWALLERQSQQLDLVSNARDH